MRFFLLGTKVRILGLTEVFNFLFYIGVWLINNIVLAMEYYSAIKRNAFGSILMRLVNLEPTIQSGVNQKERDKYHILVHIYESIKMVLMSLLAGQQRRCRHKEQTFGHNGGRGGDDLRE